jgi:hypothetical protein
MTLGLSDMRTIRLCAESSVTQPYGLRKPHLGIGVPNCEVLVRLYFAMVDFLEAKYAA